MKQSEAVAGVLVNDGDVLLSSGRDEYGDEILDVFGNFLAQGGDPVEGVRSRLEELIIPYESIDGFGKITNIIHKPEGDTELHLYVCLVNLSNEGRKQIADREDLVWLDKNAIETDIRTNRIRRILDAAHMDKPFDHYWEVDQMTSWRDAKTLKWEENKQNT